MNTDQRMFAFWALLITFGAAIVIMWQHALATNVVVSSVGSVPPAAPNTATPPIWPVAASPVTETAGATNRWRSAFELYSAALGYPLIGGPGHPGQPNPLGDGA